MNLKVTVLSKEWCKILKTKLKENNTVKLPAKFWVFTVLGVVVYIILLIVLLKLSPQLVIKQNQTNINLSLVAAILLIAPLFLIRSGNKIRAAENLAKISDKTISKEFSNLLTRHEINDSGSIELLKIILYSKIEDACKTFLLLFASHIYLSQKGEHFRFSSAMRWRNGHLTPPYCSGCNKL